jgi:hypothetical protein
MFNLDYYQSESDTMPEEIDTTSSPTTVYFHKNIRTEDRTDPETGETRTVFVYDEANVPRRDYDSYMQGKTQADIEYLYMMTGVDYFE